MAGWISPLMMKYQVASVYSRLRGKMTQMTVQSTTVLSTNPMSAASATLA